VPDPTILVKLGELKVQEASTSLKVVAASAAAISALYLY